MRLHTPPHSRKLGTGGVGSRGLSSLRRHGGVHSMRIKCPESSSPCSLCMYMRSSRWRNGRRSRHQHSRRVLCTILIHGDRTTVHVLSTACSRGEAYESLHEHPFAGRCTALCSMCSRHVWMHDFHLPVLRRSPLRMIWDETSIYVEFFANMRLVWLILSHLSSWAHGTALASDTGASGPAAAFCAVLRSVLR